MHKHRYNLVEVQILFKLPKLPGTTHNLQSSTNQLFDSMCAIMDESTGEACVEDSEYTNSHDGEATEVLKRVVLIFNRETVCQAAKFTFQTFRIPG
jgi:iron uptake system EfeUOB component EfeO/EfeM